MLRFLIDNIAITVLVANGIVHVYDLGEPGRDNLTNAMSEDFKERLIKKANLPEEAQELIWMLYHTDGIVSKWEYSDFTILPADDARMLQRTIKERISSSQVEVEGVYILLDLERTIGSGMTHYWKRNRMEYTTNIEEAGRFSEETARVIVNMDTERTVMVSAKVVDGILKV